MILLIYPGDDPGREHKIDSIRHICCANYLIICLIFSSIAIYCEFFYTPDVLDDNDVDAQRFYNVLTGFFVLQVSSMNER